MALRKARFGVIDGAPCVVETATGEVTGRGRKDLQGSFLFIPDKAKIKEPWAMVFQQFMKELALTKMQATSVKVLFYMMAHLDYENKVMLTQKMISEGMGISQPAVSKAIRELTSQGYVKKGPIMYIINPLKVWRGCADGISDAVRDFFTPLLAVAPSKRKA